MIATLPSFSGLLAGGSNLPSCHVVLIVEGGGDSFECYPDQDPISQALDGGNLPGEWEGTNRTLGLQWFDDFESYADENPISATLDGGTPFLAAVPAGEWVGT